MRITQYTIQCYTLLLFCKTHIDIDMLCNVTMYWVIVCCPLYKIQSSFLGMLRLYTKLMHVMTAGEAGTNS